MAADIALALALMAVGYVLLFIEVAIIPGFGAVGALGIIALGVGCYFLWDAGGPALGSGGILVSLVGAAWGLRAFTRSRMGRSLVLDDQMRGTASASDLLTAQVGKRARAVGALRPSGPIEVDGVRFDGMLQDGSFAAAGTALRVTGQEHGQLVLTAILADAEPSARPSDLRPPEETP